MGTELEERTDRLIWKGIGVKSVRKIAEETGIPVEEVIRRRDEILSAVDVLTVQQARQKLVITLQEISQKVQDDYDSAPYEFKAGLMNSAIAAIKTHLVELSKMDKEDDSKVAVLNQSRVRELVSLLQEVVDLSVYEAAEKYDLPADDLFLIFNANLEKATKKRDLDE